MLRYRQTARTNRSTATRAPRRSDLSASPHHRGRFRTGTGSRSSHWMRRTIPSRQWWRAKTGRATSSWHCRIPQCSPSPPRGSKDRALQCPIIAIGASLAFNLEVPTNVPDCDMLKTELVLPLQKHPRSSPTKTGHMMSYVVGVERRPLVVKLASDGNERRHPNCPVMSSLMFMVKALFVRVRACR